MEGFSRIYCVTIIATCIFSSTKGNIFGTSTESIYDYTANVRVGTSVPAPFVSQFSLHGKLIVQSSADGTAALIQLKDLKTEAYNGPLSSDDTPKITALPLQPDSFALEQPFEVIYEGGLVKHIKTDDDEKQSLWAINMKKSIAAIFQLDMKQLRLDKSYSFSSAEKTINGHQMTENNVVVEKNGNVSLRKLSPHVEPIKEDQFWSSFQGILCTPDFWNTLNKATSRKYHFDTSNNKMVINKVIAHGMTSFLPFSTSGFNQYVAVKQQFDLVKQIPSSQNYQSQKGKEHEPTFTFVRFDEVFGNRHSLAGEKGKPDTKNLVKMVHKQLQDLIDILEEVRVGGPNDGEGFLEKNNDHNNFITYKLLGVLGYMDYEALKQCYSEIGVGTSYKEEIIRDLFLDVLSHVGTKASMLLLKDLITTQSITEESAMKMLKTIPFYARQADDDLLQKYESILELKYSDQVKRTATLSFATLVNRACKKKCSPEVLEKYVLRYFELFKESTEYQWQLNYLEGLSNIEIGKVVEYLEPIIKGEQQYSHHIRFLAMWASRLHAIQDPRRVSEVYWPILEDKSQHLELRVGAFVILLLSMPTRERFNSLASLMNEEPQDSHLYYFFYSTMESLSATKYPCYQIMKKSAQTVLQHSKPPKKELLWTGNHIFDYNDPENPYGTLVQRFMVADPITGGPNVFYFLHNENYFGRSQNMLSFYVKVQGLKQFFQGKIIKLDGDEKLAKLKQLLSSLKIDNGRNNVDEPIHVELIVQFQDRAISTHYYNETTFSDIFETVKAMGAGFGSDFHINYQRLLFPMIHELTGPTDLGTPMSLTIPIPYIFSFHGNFTHDIMSTILTRRAQIDIKYWRHGGVFLTTYNPFGNLWHGISRMHSSLYHLPMNFHFSVDVVKNSVKLAMSGLENAVPGAALHVGSSVFVLPTSKIDDDLLPQLLHDSCPSCLSHHPVKGADHHNKLDWVNEDLGKLNLNYIVRYFDCDIPDIHFYLNRLFENAFDDMTWGEGGERSKDFSLPVLKVYNDLMYFPLSGRCGFVAKITPEVNSNTNGVAMILQHVSDDSKNKEKGKITLAVPVMEKYHIEGSLLVESSTGVSQEVYDWSLMYQSCEANLNHHLTYKFTESVVGAPAAEKLKVCIDAELHYPEPPVDPLRQRDPNDEEVTGSFNLIMGLASQNKCPKMGVEVKISGRANPVPDKGEPFYAECVRDRNLEEWAPEISSLTPTTQACLYAAVDSTELRRIEIRTEMPDFLSTSMSKILFSVYVLEGTDPWGKYLLSDEYTIEEYPIIKDGKGYVVEFTPNGFMLIDTIEEGERERFVFNEDKPSLSSRFDQSWTSSEEEEFERSCVLTASSISAFDESVSTYQASPCYSLAFGHCYTSKPLFAAFTKKTEVTKQLALQFWSQGNSIEILPGLNNSVSILVNGETIDFDKDNVYRFEVADSTIFRVWQRVSKKEKDSPLYLSIFAADTDILLEYTGFRLISTINSIFNGEVCGLCEGLKKSESPAIWETCSH